MEKKMKFLAINGSPRIGNTDQVVKYFIKSLKEYTDFEFEEIYLKDYPLDFCKGCHNCIFTDEKKCPQYKQVKYIEDRMMSSDCLILSSPGYMFSVTGLMKNFLDHVAYNCHRPKYFGKKFILISASTKFIIKHVFLPMETLAAAAGFKLISKLNIEMPPFPLNEKVMNKNREIIKKEAYNVFKKIRNKEKIIKPDFGSTVIFYIFRTFCRMFPGIMAADYKYFKEKKAWDKETKWYIPAKMNFINIFFSKLIENNMQKALRKIIDLKKGENFNKDLINKL